MNVPKWVVLRGHFCTIPEKLSRHDVLVNHKIPNVQAAIAPPQQGGASRLCETRTEEKNCKDDSRESVSSDISTGCRLAGEPGGLR